MKWEKTVKQLDSATQQNQSNRLAKGSNFLLAYFFL